jgi:hypothetical protein
MPDATDVTPVAAIFDRDEVPAFLREQPEWWGSGIHGFRPPLDDPAEATLWTFSKRAKAAFEAWLRARGGNLWQP